MTDARTTVARAAMIEAAEQIAAEQGLGSMALAAVQTLAGQANKSAAKYHFGSREGLVGAVLENRMAPVDQRRQELLAESGDGPLGSAEIARLLVSPLAAETIGRQQSFYARFLLQAMVDPAAGPIVLSHLRAGSFRTLRTRFRDSTTLPRDLADIRFASTVALCVTTLAMWEGYQDTGIDTTAIAADLIVTCTAVLQAPAAHLTPSQGA